ncbi:MAG TPA: Hsp20/alpha crystallin family protein [Candidatus Paceibacterota bacterium]|nr:Hsp20/alpha crystallin family protein [Candidatus Paceibacterota bacterium]
MAKSFFEKLTGASIENEEEKEETIKETITSSEDDVPPKLIKKPRKSIKKIETSETEEKSWFQEADESEEGQLTIDVFQTPSDIIIKSTVAGVKPEDIDISFTNDMITVRGRRRKEEEINTEDYYYQELYWGAFSRSVILPVEVDVDKAKADIKNGILTVKLPKSEKIKTKKIKVNVS